MPRTLTYNTAWSFAGLTIPMIAAVWAIPRLIAALGTDRFGMLTLGWTLIGYFSIFDLGLGRALTRHVSDCLGRQEPDAIPWSFWSSFAFMLCLGVLVAGGCAAVAPFVGESFLKAPGELKAQIPPALLIIAISVPLVTASAVCRGLLEAYHCFAALSAVRIAAGVFSFLGPLFALRFGRDLWILLSVLMIARLLTLVAYFLMSLQVLPHTAEKARPSWSAVSRLLRFGGWMTVSNVVSPVMTYLDRFMVGALLSVGAVAYYATPSEALTKFLLIPSAVTGVLFPALTRMLASEPQRAAALYRRSIESVLLTLLPLCVLAVLFARQGLTTWLGAPFAAHTYRVAQILTVGIFVNAASMVAFTLVQAAGRPDITAKLHLAEVPLYLMGAFWLIRAHGIEGAAIAWTVRVAADAIVLLWATKQLIGISPVPRRASIFSLVLLGLGAGLSSTSITAKLLFLLAATGGYLYQVWPALSPVFGGKYRTLLTETTVRVSHAGSSGL